MADITALPPETPCIVAVKAEIPQILTTFHRKISTVKLLTQIFRFNTCMQGL